jgi:hypothetical protein
MYSRVIPLEELKLRSVMYWLPFGGRDNGVWADTWVLLADIETDDVTPVLGLLAEADVGGYTARSRGVAAVSRGQAAVSRGQNAVSRGQNARTDGWHRLYVDTMSYHRAEDVLILFMRAKGPRPDHPWTDAKRPTTRNVTPTPHSRAIARIKDAVGRAICVLIWVALIALGLAGAYYTGPTSHPCVHPSPHRPPAAAHENA